MPQMRARRGRQFWNREYQRLARRGGGPRHLALSTEPAEDLVKFTRWLARRGGGLNNRTTVLDLGCGNGRNLIWLAKEFGVRGVGYDISAEAIKQAVVGSAGGRPDFARSSSGNAKSNLPPAPLPLQFSIRSLSELLPLADNSIDLVLDLMSSHILNAAERANWRDEIWRVLKPAGLLCFKSFLLDEDRHAERLLREHPGDESHTYRHPTLGVTEHVWTVGELENFFAESFLIHKIEKSHKHLKGRHHLGGGQPFRRRTFTAYLERQD